MVAEEAIQLLKNRKYRMSRGRKGILEVFEQANQPLTTFEVLSFLQKKNIMVDKTTVYRELQFLKEQNLLQEVPVSSNTVYYESALQNHHHHIICENCNTIAEVDTGKVEDDIQQLSQRIQARNGFIIKNHALEFFGRCTNCQS